MRRMRRGLYRNMSYLATPKIMRREPRAERKMRGA